VPSLENIPSARAPVESKLHDRTRPVSRSGWITSIDSTAHDRVASEALLVGGIDRGAGLGIGRLPDADHPGEVCQRGPLRRHHPRFSDPPDAVFEHTQAVEPRHHRFLVYLLREGERALHAGHARAQGLHIGDVDLQGGLGMDGSPPCEGGHDGVAALVHAAPLHEFRAQRPLVGESLVVARIEGCGVGISSLADRRDDVGRRGHRGRRRGRLGDGRRGGRHDRRHARCRERYRGRYDGCGQEDGKRTGRETTQGMEHEAGSGWGEC
jgi:hypothetical protein